MKTILDQNFFFFILARSNSETYGMDIESLFMEKFLESKLSISILKLIFC